MCQRADAAPLVPLACDSSACVASGATHHPGLCSLLVRDPPTTSPDSSASRVHGMDYVVNHIALRLTHPVAHANIYQH